MPRFLRVGGTVRDSVMGVKSKDVDFIALSCDPSDPFGDMLDEVLLRGGRIFEGTEKPEFGGVRGWLPEIGAADFNLPRDDGFSSDARHPDSVVLHDDLVRDLSRRDFTMNAMAEHENGTIIDPFGGLVDIEDRVLRFVGDPAARLAEDALRAFRGVRFEIMKGMIMTPDTSEAIINMTPDQFDAVHENRMRDELLRCFAHDTLRTLNVLSCFPNLLGIALERGIWLRPTLEKP